MVRVCVCAYLDPPTSQYRPLSLSSLRRVANIAESDSKARGATISGPPLLRYTLDRDRRFSPLARANKGLQDFGPREFIQGKKKPSEEGREGISEGSS